MGTIRLVQPSMDYDGEIMALRAELLAAQDADDFAGCSGLDDYDTTHAWLAHLAEMKKGMTPSVPSDSYIAVREGDNRVVGVIDLRHHIDHPILGTWGGHIGYSVHPDERRKGYATRMLQLDLENARRLGLQRVMVTCDDGNIASEKTILKNGGVYERDVPVDGRMVKRFWIEL